MSEPVSSIALTLPDGSVRTLPAGSTPLDLAQAIGPGLAKAAVGAEVDGHVIDLRQPLVADAAIRLFTTRDPEAGPFIRHSAEHVLADAVKRLWPGTEIDAGRQDHSEKYQYDFRFPRAFTPEDFAQIEKQMKAILKENATFERVEISREDAAALFTERGETLKLDRLQDIPEGETITLFRHGDFVDLCRGPHVQNAKQIGAIMLLDTGGAYYRGKEDNEMLQRIYGTAFASKKELAAYRTTIEEARKRDHRRLGVTLDLFSFDPAAPASPFFHPKGAHVYHTLVDFVRELQTRKGFEEVITPQVLDVDMWHTSGHYENYHEGMFFIEADDREFAVKPMNCPTHCLIYATQKRSYRDLPVRYADFGRLHRYERSGVTAGLTRVRTFCQDDAHVFCTEAQVQGEIARMVEMIQTIYETFAFENIAVAMSTRPEKSIGTAELWDRAEGALEAALASKGIDHHIKDGDGAFYGPKIDFQVQDALGRPWQLGTIQLDYQLPQRFDLSYVGADGAQHRPVLLHRAMLGSLERFLGILIEHTAGAFPLWLAPVQAIVLPLSEKHLDHADAVRDALVEAGLRATCDHRNEKLGYKIREATLQKIPYLLVVGEQERADGTVNVRRRGGDAQESMTLEAFRDHARALVASRSQTL